MAKAYRSFKTTFSPSLRSRKYLQIIAVVREAEEVIILPAAVMKIAAGLTPLHPNRSQTRCPNGEANCEGRVVMIKLT